MNKIHAKLFLVPALAAILTGCASEPTRFSSGPIKAHTFSFVKMDDTKQADYADKRAEIHTLVQGAIDKTLAGKGLTEVPANGDVNVLYLIIISNGATTQTINDYFGYSGGAYELEGKAHQAFAEDNRNPTGYPAGTLVIDIVDPAKRTVLWRNFVYRPILNDLPMDKRQERLQEAVNEVFKTLPLAK